MGAAQGGKGEIRCFCPWRRCRPLEERPCPALGHQPRLPGSRSKPRCRAEGTFYRLPFARGGVSVPQPRREFTHVPNHGLIPARASSAVAHSGCQCRVPALGMGTGTTGMPGLMKQKPPFGWHEVSELLPHSGLASPPGWLRCDPARWRVFPRHCPQPRASAVARSEATSTRTPGLRFIYCRSPAGPQPSFSALRPLWLFVSFFVRFSGRCVFTSPVCFECWGRSDARRRIPSLDPAASAACTTRGRGCESARREHPRAAAARADACSHPALHVVAAAAAPREERGAKRLPSPCSGTRGQAPAAPVGPGCSGSGRTRGCSWREESGASSAGGWGIGRWETAGQLIPAGTVRKPALGTVLCCCEVVSRSAIAPWLLRSCGSLPANRVVVGAGRWLDERGGDPCPPASPSSGSRDGVGLVRAEKAALQGWAAGTAGRPLAGAGWKQPPGAGIQLS